jgi:hypothetical protein
MAVWCGSRKLKSAVKSDKNTSLRRKQKIKESVGVFVRTE